jgi:molecular chaperone DnaK (HSP70)
MSKKILGIDLGTTYSCVACVNEFGQPEVIPNVENERTTPSVVWFDGQRVVVGQEAKEMSNTEPDNVCSFVKRNMGNDYFSFDHNGTTYTPEHISSFILRKLVKDTSDFLGEQVKDIVITCPAYFSFKEREATKRAGEIAGLNVLQIVNEPTAAAFAYVLNQKNAANKYVLVYDLGGGTFDTTLIRISADGVDVVCTDGDHQLGGKDWDDRLVQHLAAKFNEAVRQNIDPADDMEFYYELGQKAEQLKKQLTDKAVAKTNIVYQGNKATIEVKREEFEAMTVDLRNRTIELTNSMMSVAKKQGVAKFDSILLVGGSSRMPQVTNILKKEFRIEPQLYEPDEAVAKGAAIIGNNLYLKSLLSDKVKTGLTLEVAKKKVADEYGYSLETVSNSTKRAKNVASKTFGITVLDGFDAQNNPLLTVCNLIYRNTPLPAEKQEQFATITKDQRLVLIELLENNIDAPPPGSPESSEPLDGMTALWAGELPVQPGLPQYSPIDVTFNIDESGRLLITAYDPASGGKIVKAIPELDEAKSRELEIITQKSRELLVE